MKKIIHSLGMSLLFAGTLAVPVLAQIPDRDVTLESDRLNTQDGQTVVVLVYRESNPVRLPIWKFFTVSESQKISASHQDLS